MGAEHWPKLEAGDSWRSRSLEERATAIESACRTAMQILEGSSDRARRLAHVDPVPASTLRHLRRLARK
jgi:hypothetical protein